MAIILIGGAITRAGVIFVPNAGFEDYASVGTTSANWGVNQFDPPLPPQIASTLTPNHLNQEFFSSPASFGSGWRYTGNAPTFPNNQWGLQHPEDSYFKRSSDGTAQGKLLEEHFQGEFIGFMNVRLGAYPTGYVQSGILGQLSAVNAGYTLQVAAGARTGGLPSPSGTANWNDVAYEIALVADPTAAAVGSTGGTVLGTPATITLTPSVAVFGANTALLTYVLPLADDDPNVGRDFAIRITATNTGTKAGLPNPGSPQNFSQANFDNVRLFDVPNVPEPASFAMLLIGAACATRRRARPRPQR